MADEVTNLFRSASALLKIPEPEDDELEISDDEVVNFSALRPKKNKKTESCTKAKKNIKTKNIKSLT